MIVAETNGFNSFAMAEPTSEIPVSCLQEMGCVIKVWFSKAWGEQLNILVG